MSARAVWHESQVPDPGLPARFADAVPAGIANAAIRDVVDRYIAAFWEEVKQGVAPGLFGRPGEYKTYGAAVIVRYAIAQRLPCLFIECGPWFLRADALFFDAKGRHMLDEAAQVQFLVLDDVTQVLPGTRAAELMANLLGQRFAAQLPTLVTGNAVMKTKDDLQNFGKLYRPDFARRLRHGATERYWAAV